MSDKSKLLNIFIRYFILILIALPNFWIFYFVFTPLTLYPVYFLLSIFFNASLTGTTILIGSVSIELIEACIAGTGYYLLSILNLSTPNIKLKKRINMLLIAFASFLILNILRIFSLSLLAVSGSSWFDLTHKLFWYLVSIVFVIGIWFIEVRLFKIKEIPFYSDIKLLYKKSSLK